MGRARRLQPASRIKHHLRATGDPPRASSYSRCAGGSEVVLCSIDGGGHTWPGGLPIPLGKTSTSISATDTMIDFFLAHPMP